MNIDPQIQPFLAGMSGFPKVGTVPVTVMREAMKQVGSHFPKLDVPLSDISDRTIPGPACEIPVRIYTPQGSGPFPVIVHFHGGGWIMGDLDSQDMICRGLAHGATAIVVSIDYRLSPEHPYPAPVDDCWAGLLWVAANAGSFNGIADRIAVSGDSAGSNLAASIALKARDAGGPALCGQVLFYGSMDYPSEKNASMLEMPNAPFMDVEDVYYFWHQFLTDPETQQHDPMVSPMRAASLAGIAPAFVCTAETDPTREYAELYGLRLAEAGVPVLTRRYTGMVHGFMMWLGIIDGAQTCLNDVCDWLTMRFTRGPL